MIEIPLSFYAGETFAPQPFLWQYNLNGVWTPINMTGFSSMFIAKQDWYAPDPPFILATTANGMETINGPAGSIQLILPASYTSALVVPFEGKWAQWVTSPSGVVTRLFGGILKVHLGES